MRLKFFTQSFGKYISITNILKFDFPLSNGYYDYFKLQNGFALSPFLAKVS